MYVVNKIVGCLVSPLALFWLATLAAFALWRLRRARMAAALLCLGFAWLWIWSMPATGRIVGAPLERPYLAADERVPAVEAYPEAAAIVLLGGGMGVETNLSDMAEMFANADRVWHAVRLFKAGKAPRIVATGIGVRESTGGLLADFGVPAEAVSFLEARNTEEEARAVAAASGTNASPTKMLLVTSAWHMRRALFTFNRYAPSLDCVPSPSDFENSFFAVRPVRAKDFLPDSSSLDANVRSFREWFGYYGYKWLRR